MAATNSMTKGFTLIEVLIALLVSNIALLGLAAGQLKSLQYATNSFNYTVSLIQANNAAEKIWADICMLQDGRLAFDEVYLANLQPEFDKYNLELEGVAIGGFASNFTIKVNWANDRIKAADQIFDENNINIDNQIAINAAYPQLPGNCNV